MVSHKSFDYVVYFQQAIFQAAGHVSSFTSDISCIAMATITRAIANTSLWLVNAMKKKQK